MRMVSPSGKTLLINYFAYHFSIHVGIWERFSREKIKEMSTSECHTLGNMVMFHSCNCDFNMEGKDYQKRKHGQRVRSLINTLLFFLWKLIFRIISYYSCKLEYFSSALFLTLQSWGVWKNITLAGSLFLSSSMFGCSPPFHNHPWSVWI
jgi:hypothetical protein